MARFSLPFTLVVTLALAMCAQPVIAAPFSNSLLGGEGFFNSIAATDGIGGVDLNQSNLRLYLGGDEDVTIFMKIDIGTPVGTATLTTGGDIILQGVSQPGGGVLANATLSVGSGLVDAGDPSLGLVNETELLNLEGGGDWPHLSAVDIGAAVLGSSEIWVALHAGQDSWRQYGTRVDPNAILTVEGTDIVRGDMDLDGSVTTADVSLFVLGLTNRVDFVNQLGYAPDDIGDIDLNGVFDFADMNAFNGLLPLASASVVPEPASASLLVVAMGAMALVGCRRKGPQKLPKSLTKGGDFTLETGHQQRLGMSLPR